MNNYLYNQLRRMNTVADSGWFFLFSILNFTISISVSGVFYMTHIQKTNELISRNAVIFAFVLNLIYFLLLMNNQLVLNFLNCYYDKLEDVILVRISKTHGFKMSKEKIQLNLKFKVGVAKIVIGIPLVTLLLQLIYLNLGGR